MLDLFISSFATAIATFALFLIPKSHSRGPLIGVLLCLLYFSAGTILFELTPLLIQLYVSFIPTVFFLFIPVFWLYHDATIASKAWHWHRALLKHFIPLPVTLLLSMALVVMPREEFEQMFFAVEATNNPSLNVLSVLFFLSVVSWCLLSLGYMLNIIYRTIRYRKRLKLHFADEFGKKLHWIVITSALIVLTWAYSLVVLAVGDQLRAFDLSDTGVLILLTSIIWTISINGVRQRPGFEDIFKEKDTAATKPDKKPYERSALNDQDMQRIAAKLSEAISREKLHLGPDVNLLKLAKHIGEPSQYVSQTLTQHLNTTFFDFINRARITEAERLLVSSNTSVLDIAHLTGFNSRSSFYKAFKHYTQQTPSQYRSSKR
ncbi:helix-turn-helix transcriptional regulator [Aestuariibacter salexigens]|uniref:helix-turn-helix transcriptional regulator n=1 Tax=Aestuariibacter salexigens TaxID=226010 RepID=UPI0004021813|nr:AraC family transcriptional regulator [Aestuariibacter salexigens]